MHPWLAAIVALQASEVPGELENVVSIRGEVEPTVFSRSARVGYLTFSPVDKRKKETETKQK